MAAVRPTRSQILRVSVLLLTGLVFAGGVSGGAASGAAAGVDDNPFVMLFPALATAGAPDWLRQGTRITYYSAAASVVGGKYQYKEDENGGWIDQSTGKRYSQQEITGASGHGYTQLNIVWLDRSVAVVDIRSYQIAGVNGPATILTYGGFVGLPGAGSDFWLSPQVLRGIAPVSTAGMTILRMAYPIRDRQYNALRFQGASESWVFDLNTGVLLHSGLAGVGAPIRGPVGPTDSREGSTYLSQNTLVDVHTTNLPWATVPAPEWVARVKLLRYDGAINVYVPGGGAVAIPFSTTLEWMNGGANWARYRQTVVQPGPTGMPVTAQADRVFGPGVIGGHWIAPQVLRQLRPGHTLDTDPVTRVTVSVGQPSSTPQGTPGVSISELNTAQRIDYLYDLSSGRLVSVDSFNKIVNQQIQLRLTRWQ